MKERKLVRRVLVFGTVFLMIFVVFVGMPINVSADPGTITVPDDYSTIQAAINAAISGDTVYVRAGTYYEHLTINKQLTLQGEDRDTTIINGGGSGNVVYVSAHYVTISGLKITNGIDGIELSGSWSGAVSHFTLRDTIIDANTNHAIESCHTQGHWLIENCIISNNGGGALQQAHQANYFVIQNCEIFGNGGGLDLGHGSNTVVKNNLIHHNSWDGIQFDGMRNSLIENNKVYSNYYGIRHIFYRGGNTIRDNIIQHNEYGILLDWWSSYNKIYHNDIIDNTIQAMDKMGNNIWDNGYPSGGNYWSDYTGVDANGDGIGDTPYVIDSQNKDNYPLMCLFNVNGYPPVAVAGGPYVGIEGNAITFDASGSSDPDGDTLEYRWDFNNDGTWDTGWSTDPTATNTWNDDYSGEVKVEVYDGEFTNTDTATVTINNVAPTVNAGLDLTVNEGDTVYFTGSFTDPGTEDTHTIEWDFNDGNTATDILTPSHAYGDNGIYTIILTITDNNGGVGSDTLTVVVNNVAPTVDAGSDQTVFEGDLVTFSGTFTDPGFLDTHSMDWDFDDGITTTDILTPDHAYGDNGLYNVDLTVTDDDGGLSTDTVSVAVNNVAPIVDAGPDQIVNRGDTVSFSGTYNDPGWLDTHTIEWDFNDGNVAIGTLIPTNIYIEKGTFIVTLTIIDNDGGVGTDMLTINVVAPTADAGSDQTINEGDVVEFDGSGSIGSTLSLDKYGVYMTVGNPNTDRTVLKINPDGTELMRIPKENLGINPLVGAADGVAINQEDGTIWVWRMEWVPGQSYGMSSISHLSPDGEEILAHWDLINIWVKRLVVDPTDGGVFLCADYDPYIYKYSADGNLIFKVKYQFSYNHWAGPCSVNPDEQTIWATCSWDDKVVKLNSADGSLVLSLTGFDGASAISVDQTDGSVWVGCWNGNEVVKLNTNGEELVRVNVGTRPNWIKANPADGGAWVGFSSNEPMPIKRLDSNGNVIAISPPLKVGGYVPFDITSDGTIWVSEQSLHKLNKLSPTGELLLTIGGDPITFREPGFITIFPQVETPPILEKYSVYMTEGNPNTDRTVLKINPDGTELMRIPKENLGVPIANHLDINPADGTIWVIDYDNGAVSHLSADGEEILASFTGLMYIKQLEVDPIDGGIWLSPGYDPYVYKYSSDGTLLYKLSSPSPYPHFCPSISVYPPENAVWMNDYQMQSVMKLNSDDGSLIFSKSGFLTQHLSVDQSDGSVWITDGENNVVVKLDTNGNELVRVNVGNFPTYIKANPIDGGAWVNFYYENSFKRLDSNGNVIASTSDFKIWSRGPFDIAPNGNVWIVECERNKIHKLSPTGELLLSIIGDENTYYRPDFITIFPHAEDIYESLDIVSYEWDFESDGIYDYQETADNAPDGAFDGKTTHTYGDNGIYTVTLRVADERDAIDTDISMVTVNNVAPTVNAGADQTAIEGDTVYFGGSYSDPGWLDTHTIEWDFDDGDIVFGTLEPEHEYGDNGDYTVTLTVIDDDGSSTIDTLIITVNNVAPTVNAGPDQVVNEGSTVDFTGTFSDPGWLDTHAIEWDLGDDNTVAGELTPSHEYGDNGVYTVTLTVTDDDGDVGSDTLIVTVINVVPIVEAGSDIAVQEGNTFYFGGSFSDPGWGDTHTIYWNFGDGNTASGTLNPEHMYGDNGDYTAILTVVDDDGGTDSDTLTVTVNNAAPTGGIIGISSGAEGSAIGFTATGTDMGSDDLTFEWDWGDGTTDTITTYYNNGLSTDPPTSPGGTYPFSQTDTVSHTYYDNNEYIVTLTISDDDSGIFSDTTTVSVSNVPPSIESFGTYTIDEGSAIAASTTATDPGNDDLTFIWEFSSGPTIVKEFTASGTSSVSVTDEVEHTFGDNGVYSLELTVEDDNEGSNSYSTIVTVNNVAPTVEPGVDQIVNEGDIVTFSGSFTDPSWLDTHTIEWDFNDGNSASGTLAPTHIFADNGVYTVTLTVTDDDGGIGVDTLVVIVNNVVPTVDAGSDQTANEGNTILFSGTFYDPSIVDTHTIEWNFNDGYTAVGTLNPTHVYGDNGVYVVTLTVTDDDGGVGIDIITITVNNVAPSVSIDNMIQPFPEFILPSDELEFTGSFSDPGSLDTHTIDWDFDDGTVIQDTTLTEIHEYTNPGIYTVTLTITDDDGGFGTATIILVVSSPAEAADEVVDMVGDVIDELVDVPPGLEQNLLSPLGTAIEKLDEGNENAGVNKLGAFINQVEAQRGKKLTDEQANALIESAQWIIDNVENGG